MSTVRPWWETPAGQGVRAFRNQPFRRLVSGFAANQSGFWLSHLALQGLIADLSDSDPFKNSLLFLALFVPGTVVPFVAGVFVDQRDRLQVMSVGYGAVAAVAATYAVVAATDQASLPLVLVLAVLLGAAFAVVGPASSALMANTVPLSDIRSAITIHSAVNNLSRIAGPIAATPIIATGRYELAFGIYCLATVVALLILQTVKARPADLTVERVSFVTRLKEGFAHARERRPAMKILFTQMTLSVFGVGHTALMPAFAKDALDSPDGFALLGAATGAGAMLGALLNGYDRRGATIGRGAAYLAAYGLCLGAFGVSGNLLWGIVAQLAVGVFYFLCATQLQTLIQEIVDDSKRGRVMALFQVSWGGVVWIGTLLLGTLAGPVGLDVRLVVIGTAAVCVTVGVTMAFKGRDEPTAEHYAVMQTAPAPAGA